MAYKQGESMDLQIDVGIQGPMYTFRVNPKAVKLLTLSENHRRGIYPSAITITFESEDLPKFKELHDNSGIRSLRPLLIGFVATDLKKMGFSEILYYDAANQKELLRLPV